MLQCKHRQSLLEAYSKIVKWYYTRFENFCISKEITPNKEVDYRVEENVRSMNILWEVNIEANLVKN